MKDYLSANWLSLLIQMAIILISVGICYGAITMRITAIEKDVAQSQPDHDILIALNSKVDSLAISIKEIKSDIKDIRTSISKTK